MLKEEKGIFFLAEMDEYSPDIMFSYEISVRWIFLLLCTVCILVNIMQP